LLAGDVQFGIRERACGLCGKNLAVTGIRH